MITDYIKDPLRVKLRDYEILVKVKSVNSTILMVDQENKVTENEYLEVLKVMSENCLVKEGDIVIKVSGIQTMFEVNGEEYAILRENSILLAIDKDNFKV